MKPDPVSIQESLKECRSIGDSAFLEKYANGRKPLGWHVLDEGRPFPLKAIWAAAHRPSVLTKAFKTGDAMAGLRKLGWDKFADLRRQVSN